MSTALGCSGAAVDTYGRAFHDHLAGTVVIDVCRFPLSRRVGMRLIHNR